MAVTQQDPRGDDDERVFGKCCDLPSFVETKDMFETLEFFRTLSLHRSFVHSAAVVCGAPQVPLVWSMVAVSSTTSARMLTSFASTWS